MADIIELHDRISVTFSPEISKLIRAEMKRSGRTAEEIASEGTKFVCEAMAAEFIEVKRGS